MKRIVQYFIPATIPLDADSQRKARLTVAVWLIISIFTLQYTVSCYLIDFPMGMVSQLPLCFITICCLILYKYEFNPRIIYPIYFTICTLSISIASFYSGGFLSLIFPWLATTPIVAVLVWSKRGALFSTGVVIIAILFFFTLYLWGYAFPNQIQGDFQKTYYLSTHLGLVLILFWVAIVFENAKDTAFGQLKKTMEELKISNKRSNDLLLNILPEEVSRELKERGAVTAHEFDHVTVLFTDFVNFTVASERMSSQELVDELHHCFKAFDEIIGRYHIEKIKTVGDAYLAVSGLPLTDNNHALHIAKAALDIQDFIRDRVKVLGEKTFNIRIGIHSGSVVAGIVGVKKFAYDIWGDTVNTAARMEQSSEPGRINISGATHSLIKDHFNCIYRGEIDAKHKGKLAMHFLERKV
ncbi:MAG: adenylate/guanylate cyclase domain-containing protein [Saprospiraceae bacterium]|jgi:class 3 adenylate cyclase|nr:adenylate/guanylate cyclase domain-containing protein [Saprospiraceae bacterium]